MERLTHRYMDGTAWVSLNLVSKMGEHECVGLPITKLATYEDSEEQGQILRPPCKVGDTVYLIDRDENNKFKVYEGKWERVSLVQTSKDGPFNLCGEISYDLYDCFYDDGRIMKHGMYVGQESTKIGEIVFLTKEEAEVKLKEMI
jgi:hypothetical protein